jgi:ammonia channel protein AmtB
MVSVTAAADNVELWASAVIGLLAGCIYLATKELLIRFEIDDPLDITQKHGICGIWSLLATGIFDKEKGFVMTG